jgi:SARP family transcriptional regulator, regulator of embCAB operon
VEVCVLGPVEVRLRARRLGPGDLGGRKPKQVLQLLAAAGGGSVPKETLIDLLWGDRPPRRPVAALENHVWVLRRHLAAPDGAEPVIATTPGAYRLAIERVVIDLARFDALVLSAAAVDPARARRSLRAALALVRGEAFEDEPYAEWAVGVRETYRLKVSDARLELAELALSVSDLATALEQASLVLREDPLSERATRAVMQAHHRRGDRDRSVAVFNGLRRRLHCELGVEPLPATLAVLEAVRRGVAHEPVSARGPASARAPASARGPASRVHSGLGPEPSPSASPQGRVPMIGRRREVAELLRLLREGLADRVGSYWSRG